MLDQDKIKDFFKNYFWAFLIPLLIYAFYSDAEDKSEIKNNYGSAYAKVYDVSKFYRRVNKKTRLEQEIKYEFYYKGKKYNGIESVDTERKFNVGNYIMVGFSTLNPKKKTLYLDVQYKRFLKKDESGKIDTIYRVFDNDKNDKFIKTMNHLRDNH